MKKLLFLLSTLLVIAYTSCKNSSVTENKDATTTKDNRNIYTAEDGRTVGINVSLNNGAKWEANMETTRGVGQMAGIVGDFPANASLEDYRNLNKKLATEFQSILQNCSMKGKAHDQLHNYLMPLKEKIDKFGTEDLDSCNRLLPKVKDYLLKYSHFFFT